MAQEKELCFRPNALKESVNIFGLFGLVDVFSMIIPQANIFVEFFMVISKKEKHS